MKKTCPYQQYKGVWGGRRIVPRVLNLSSRMTVVVSLTPSTVFLRAEKNEFVEEVTKSHLQVLPLKAEPTRRNALLCSF